MIFPSKNDPRSNYMIEADDPTQQNQIDVYKLDPKKNTHPLMICGHAANGICTSKNGIKYNPGIPCCVICSCNEQESNQPDSENKLHDRQAICCSKQSLKPSTLNLAFFEYRGPNSKVANTMCSCGFAEIAHTRDYSKMAGWRPKKCCDNFEARGAWEYDLYYCGCRGWN